MSDFRDFDVQPDFIFAPAEDGSSFAVGEPDDSSGVIALYSYDPEVGAVALDLDRLEAKILLACLENALAE